MKSEGEDILSDPTPTCWEFAGLLLTYWCNARCAFCYVNCGPQRQGWMEIEQALALWRGLDEAAAEHGQKMRIHLAGGEPFGDWPRLLAIVRGARDAGLTPLEKIETNAYWATSDGLTRARLEQLAALGMGALVVSTDVYHQRYVPFERVRRCVEIAREVLGPGNVRVRWWDYYKSRQPGNQATRQRGERQKQKLHKQSRGEASRAETLEGGVREMGEEELRAAYLAAMERHQDRFTGRAADALAALAQKQATESFRGMNCVKEILHSRHVHIDRYGNVFPGVCNGIVLGDASRHSIAELWRRFAKEWPDRPVVSALVEGGSLRLMESAQEHGYRPRVEGYAGKCHLCHDVRRFLFERGIWPSEIGPGECYL